MANVSARDARLAAPRQSVRRRMLHGLWAHRWFALAALVAAGLGGWESARVLLGPAVVADRVTRGAIVETVVATGNVLTPYRANIGSQITGTVTEVLVEEGQQVVKGQPLITLDDTELNAGKVQAEGALDAGDFGANAGESAGRAKDLRSNERPGQERFGDPGRSRRRAKSARRCG